jgi:hypothetical protein
VLEAPRQRARLGAPQAIVRALLRALPLLASGRLLGRLVLWTLGSFVLWGLIGYLAFAPATAALQQLTGGEGSIGHVFAAVVVLLMLAVAAIVTVFTAVAMLAMPVIVELVGARYFPALARRHGGRWHGSLRNAVAALGVFVPLWLLCLVLLGVPPLYLLASWCLSGWVNQRLFRYDALAEHADADELAALPRAIRGRLFGLGLVLAPLTLVPFVNLVMPLYAGIAFTCLCLDALAQRRTALDVDAPALASRAGRR